MSAATTSHPSFHSGGNMVIRGHSKETSDPSKRRDYLLIIGGIALVAIGALIAVAFWR